MKYSDELIAEVKELFPNNKEMHQHADNGNEILGRYLDDSSSGSIRIDTILLATSLEQLQTLARFQKRKVELCKKWCKEAYPDKGV